MHESFEPQHEVRTATPRAFGLMLVALCLLVALWPLVSRQSPRGWALGLALAVALAAWRAPQIYAVPNRAWMKLGELLARIVAPLALALLFFGLFVPMGWLLRAVGHDPLRLRRDMAETSFWIERDPPGPSGNSLTHQF
jgi:peptidoglycan biosynthesis protein MviN/MurJ (putative lipid II flippase)